MECQYLIGSLEDITPWGDQMSWVSSKSTCIDIQIYRMSNAQEISAHSVPGVDVVVAHLDPGLHAQRNENHYVSERTQGSGRNCLGRATNINIHGMQIFIGSLEAEGTQGELGKSQPDGANHNHRVQISTRTTAPTGCKSQPGRPLVEICTQPVVICSILL